MSIPPPNFDILFQGLLKEVREYRATVSQIYDEEAKALAQSLIGQLETELSTQKFHPTEESVRRIQKLALMKVNQTYVRLGEMMRPDSISARFIEEGRHLYQSVNAFAQVVLHRKEIEEGGFGEFLDKGWGQIELKVLIEEKHPWALDILDRGILVNHPFALKVLVHEGLGSNLLAKHKDLPYLKEFVTEVFTKAVPPDQLERGYAVLTSILKYGDCDWAREMLINRLKTHHDQSAVRTITYLFNARQNKLPWIKIFVFENLIDLKGWAIEVVVSFLIKCPSEDLFKQISSEIMAMAKANVGLQIALSCAVILFPEDSPFRAVFETKRKIFQDVENGYPLEIDSQVRRIARYDEEFFRAMCPESFDWDNLDGHYRINVLRLLMHREQRLIRMTRGEEGEDRIADRVMLTCFPKTDALMLGMPKTGTESDERILRELLDLLDPYGVSIECFLGFAEEIPFEHPRLSVMVGPQMASLWMRDSFMVHRVGIGLPCPMHLDGRGIATRLEESRTLRMINRSGRYENYGGRVTFGSLGSVDQGLNQLRIFQYLVAGDPDLKNHRFSFTHMEGGNVLIGKEKGRPYALIGRDTVEYNLRALKKEFAEIGFVKGDRGNWVLGDPYQVDESKFDEEDLRFLFAKDLGLDFSRQIIYVEQPEYHLDVSMTILDGKTIAVNHSGMALDVWDEYASKKMLEPDFEFDRDIYPRTLHKITEIAAYTQQYEDAAAADLEKQGFNVVRVGGAYQDLFKSHPELHKVNFFNFVSMTVPVGDKIVLAMDCDPVFKELFEQFIHTNVADVREIHFLNRGICESLQAMGGGMHCICKEKAYEGSGD